MDCLDRGSGGNCGLSGQGKWWLLWIVWSGDVLVIVDSLVWGSIGNCGLSRQGKYW